MVSNSSEELENTLHTQIQYRLVEALSVSENRYHKLLDNISQIVFTLDTNFVISFLNKAWQSHTGFDIKDCLGKPLKNFISDSDFDCLNKALAETASPKFELCLICKDEVSRWFEINISHESDKNTSGYSGTLINIHEKKIASLALLSEELRFKNVVETISEVLFQTDTNYTITFINPAWTSLTGYSEAETLGKSLVYFIHSEEQDNCILYLNSIELNATALRNQFRLTCATGDSRWMSLLAQKNIASTSAKEWFLTGAMLDMTEQISMELALDSSQERYALLASSTTDGIWDWDLINDSVYLSPRWKAMLGYENHEIENCFASWQDRVHPDDLKLAMADLTACVEGKSPFLENIHRLKHKDGSWRWIYDRGAVVRNNSGLPYRMLGSHADVTLVKKTEDELKRREQELEAIFTMSPDGIVTVTKQGFIQSINPAFISMTGFKLNKLTGLTEEAFDACFDQICNQTSPYSNNAIANQKTYVIDSRNGHFPKLKRSDNTKDLARHTKKILILNRTERLLSNETIEKVIYFRDVTIETEIAEMKSAFLATAAHELRTPMASVFGFSELLLSREYDKETTQEILSTIYHQSASLVNILNQLLDLARIESRLGMDFVFIEQPLLNIVERAINDLMVPGDPRIIKRNKLKGDFQVFVDADKLRQVITNVLSNAYKYSKTGDIELSIKERQTNEQAEVGIVIRDHGIGMTKEHLKQIYTRFWRAKDMGDITGTGLGMSLVKEIMDIHEGLIDIISKPGIGTTVTLWLKLVSANKNME